MHYQGIDGYVYNVLENEKIASGGEGTIYAIQGNDKQVAKIFRDDKKTKDREEKLRLMVSKKNDRRTIGVFYMATGRII